jgi:phosphotriesterase-related protein
MATIQSVTGPLDTAELGQVLMHEHIIVLDPEVQANYPGRWNEEAEIEKAAAQMRSLKEVGFDTVVDLTVIPMGREVKRIREIAKRSGMNVLVATGVYALDQLPPPLVPAGEELGPDLLERLFVADIEEGTADTGIRSAVIKCATDAAGLTQHVELVLRAAARAHRRTGVPISTHTSAGHRSGLDQQRIFREEGVDLSRVIIGHSGDTTDLDYLEELIGNGSYLGMDRFGIDLLLPFADRVATVAQLCERGHADRLVLSHDTASFNDWLTADVASFQPNWHYMHIPEDVLPALRESGVEERRIEQMLVENPRRIFEVQGGY